MPVEATCVREGCVRPLRLAFAADSHAVRQALAATLAHPVLAQADLTFAGQVEIVLAEVLNNIVEHGYANGSGTIRLVGRRHRGGVLFRITDLGRPFPGGTLPEGQPPDPGSDGNPPEGGFGWFLIRRLSCALRYRRGQGRNRLLVLLCPEQSEN
ncbi:ATP-binding protein [Aliigemmobacter aestuarii]|nr:ATP-binding protein [Gemmobacter aestuarii]